MSSLIWAVDRYCPLRDLYCCPCVDESGAPSLRDVVRRHESLRTVFRDGADEPHQVVLDLPERAMVLQYREPAGTELRKAMYEASARPFALSGELPFRAWLFALGPRDHVRLLSVHHMVSDGWSRQLLARDLSRAYAARRRGVTPDTPRLPVTACPRSCDCRWTGRVGRCPTGSAARSRSAWTKGLHTALTEVARAEGTALFKVHSLLPAPTRTTHPPQQSLTSIQFSRSARGQDGLDPLRSPQTRTTSPTAGSHDLSPGKPLTTKPHRRVEAKFEDPVVDRCSIFDLYCCVICRRLFRC